MEHLLLIGALLALVLLVFLASPLTCGRRAAAESGLKPLWQERCGGKIGALAIAVPGIRIAVYDRFLVISFIGPTVIPYKQVETAAVVHGTGLRRSAGVRIKLRGLRSEYRLNSREPSVLVNLIERRTRKNSVESHH